MLFKPSQIVSGYRHLRGFALCVSAMVLFLSSNSALSDQSSASGSSLAGGSDIAKAKVKYVRELFDVVFDIKSKYGSDSDIMKQKYKEKLYDYVDVIESAKYAAGPSWRRLTNDQKQEYIFYFTEILLDSLVVQIKNIARLSSGMVKVGNNARLTAPGSLMHEVDADLNFGEIKIHITLLVKHGYKDGKFKIIKMFADGLDVSLGLKTEFQDYLNENNGNISGFVTFVRDLRDKYIDRKDRADYSVSSK